MQQLSRPAAAQEPAPTTGQRINEPLLEASRRFYDALAPERARYRAANQFYYDALLERFRFLVTPGQRVLEVGCGDGWLLRRLEPAYGVGIDISPEMIRQARAANADAPALHFRCGAAETTRHEETFDVVILSDALGCLTDVQQSLLNLRSACHDATRVIIHYHGMVWDGALRAAQRLGLKMPARHQNWIAPNDLRNLLTLTDFEVVWSDRQILAPRRIPLVSRALNRYVAPLPIINQLCLANLLVVRKRPMTPAAKLSTSIVIPCRNEKGNIVGAVERVPRFGGRQELIFVDGHSTDGTVEEIERVRTAHPERDIKLFIQEGRGKGDAVRLGFAKASGDVLMILDADLTMPPEDLPKFYDALATGKGEFVNGSRLIYPMEHEAMQFLNVLGNKFFSVTLSWIMNQPLKDTLCGTKVLRRSDYDRIARGRAYFGDFDPFGDFDLLFGAAKQNLRVIEVPIRYRSRTYGTTNISRFRHGLLLLRMSAFAMRKLKLR